MFVFCFEQKMALGKRSKAVYCPLISLEMPLFLDRSEPVVVFGIRSIIDLASASFISSARLRVFGTAPPMLGTGSDGGVRRVLHR